jgi:hypothetical protein
MHFSANQSIAQQHIDQLHHEAHQRRLARGRPRDRKAVPAARKALREAVGYRLVVLGWRLLDTSPRLAQRPAR